MADILIQSFFHPPTYVISHVVADLTTRHCAIIDPVLDFERRNGRIGHIHADSIIAFIRRHELTVDWILESSLHHAHITAAPYIKQKIGGKTAISNVIRQMQRYFKPVFNMTDLSTDGRDFNLLLSDGHRLRLGSTEITVLHTPGHSPCGLTFVIEDHAFTGDTIFMPDYGTARCDLPGGDASTLFRSIRKKILTLPDRTTLYPCHDYPPPTRPPAWACTVGEQKHTNVHIHDGINEAAFITLRASRDSNLPMPQLYLLAAQFNLRAGNLPPADKNGIHYLKLPLNHC